MDEVSLNSMVKIVKNLKESALRVVDRFECSTNLALKTYCLEHSTTHFRPLL